MSGLKPEVPERFLNFSPYWVYSALVEGWKCVRSDRRVGGIHPYQYFSTLTAL